LKRLEGPKAEPGANLRSNRLPRFYSVDHFSRYNDAIAIATVRSLLEGMRFSELVGGSVALLCAVVTLLNVVEERTLSSALAESRDAAAKIRKQISQTSLSVEHKKEEITAAQRQLAATPSKTISPSAEIMRNNPEVARLVGEYFRGTVDRRFLLFYRMAGLRLADIARFQEIVTSGMTLNLPVAGSMLPFTLGSPASDAEIEQRIESEFGSNVARQYNEYKRLTDLSIVVAKIQTDLAYMADPLDDAQIKRLSAVILENNPDFQRGLTFDSTKTDWNLVLEKGTDGLSDNQKAALVRASRVSQYQSAVTRSASGMP
jgi:hypothetical protein